MKNVWPVLMDEDAVLVDVVVGVAADVRPAVDHEDAAVASGRQALRDDRAGDARADHDGVVGRAQAAVGRQGHSAPGPGKTGEGSISPGCLRLTRSRTRAASTGAASRCTARCRRSTCGAAGRYRALRGSSTWSCSPTSGRYWGPWAQLRSRPFRAQPGRSWPVDRHYGDAGGRRFRG